MPSAPEGFDGIRITQQPLSDNTAGGLVKPTPLFRSVSLSRLPSLAHRERIALPFC